jgi:single-strand DNA-binding protein
MKESTEWVRMTAFRQLAEIIGKYLKKGSKIYASGKMVTRKYQGKDGSDRYSTEIVLDNMQMLDGKQDGAPARPAQSGRMDTQNRASMAAQAPPEFDDDIPF